MKIGIWNKEWVEGKEISDIIKIRKLVRHGKYEFSKHAERERELDMIPVQELEDALSTGEIIESYPDDPRGESCLVLGSLY